jgi:folate-dependent phosphoribosylglycinamide formyltransferase PurN
MRIVLLCNQYLSSFDQAVLNCINNESELHIVGALINTRPKPSIVQRIKRELKRGRGGYVFIQIINALLKKGSHGNNFKTMEYCQRHNLKALETNTLYRSEVYEWINLIKPDILFLRGFGIINEPILSIAPYGVLSYHHADINKYRGGPPVFWEMYNDEKEVGITIQILDAGLDTGTVVLQRFVPLTKGESWSFVKKKVYLESESMAADAFLKLLLNPPFKSPIGPKGKLYTLPNLAQWVYLQAKVLKALTLRK